MKFKNQKDYDIVVESKSLKVDATFETDKKDLKSHSQEIKNLVAHKYIGIVKA